MRLKLAVAFLVLTHVVSGLAAAPPSLSAPTLVDGQIEFTLTCESNVAYRIEASTNLQSWFPVATNTGSGVSRQIRVPDLGPKCFYRAFARTPLFNFAIVARQSIQLRTNNIVVDSFDSDDPLRSTDGQYDPVKRGDGGDVASVYGLTNDGGNVQIYGRLLTSDALQLSIGPSGSIGSVAWHLAGRTGIEPGWWRGDLELDLPQAVAPYTAGTPPTMGLYNGVFYNYVLSNDAYTLTSLRLNSGQKMLVTGNAALYVSAVMVMNGSGSAIEIVAGASLRLYIGAGTASIGGDGVLNDNPASAFVYYGLPSNTAIEITKPFTGCIYAPNARISLFPEGPVVGAIVGRSLEMLRSQQVHYDEALRRNGPFTW